MPNLQIRLVLGFVFSLPTVSPALAEGPAACGGNPIISRVAEVVDGVSFRLTDGRLVRLANLIAPLPIDGDPAAMTRAKSVLTEMANGKAVQVFLSSEDRDRYGRLSALGVLMDDKKWLEAELLTRGSVRVYPTANDKCAKGLLQFEMRASAARAGLWAEERFAKFDAEAVSALLAAEGRFVVVEGTIRRVGDRRGRVYLDFGQRFNEDFTIIVPDRLRKSLAILGPDPKSWRGKRVRVRGILLSWGGPAIELNSAQAIELLDPKLPASE